MYNQSTKLPSMITIIQEQAKEKDPRDYGKTIFHKYAEVNMQNKIGIYYGDLLY